MRHGSASSSTPARSTGRLPCERSRPGTSPRYRSGSRQGNFRLKAEATRSHIPNMSSEFRFAARSLARWRGGLAVAILTLAVGIGTATTLYALVRVLLADLPGVPELDRVGRIYASSPALGVERSEVALNEFDSSLSRAASFGAIGAYAQSAVTVGSGDDERQLTAGYASPGFFRALGVPPAEGRIFTASDLGAARPVALVSDAFWRRRFAGRPLTDVSLVVNGVDRAVVGVMPAEFSYGFVGIDADVWIPLGRPSWDAPAIVSVFARLGPGVGWSAAARELDAMKAARGSWTWRAIPIPDDTRHRAAAVYGFTLGPAIVVLLLACVNVACMLLARGIARDAVVFGELASAVALIVFAAMLLNMFRAFGMVKPTFDADRLVTMRVAAANLDQITARVAAIPGIDRVTVSSGMLGGRGGAGGVRVRADGGQPVVMSQIPVGAAFFETLGLPMLRGRPFDAAELRGHAAVAVLSESAARALAPSGDPIGLRIHVAARTSASAVVIGVCRDAIDYGSLARIGLYPPNLYVPFDAAATIEPVILARASADPHRVLRAEAA